MDTESAYPALVVAELTGPTVLAQGPAVGRRCVQIRLGGCNLTCVWCDAASTWDASRFDLSAQLVHWPVDDLAARARAQSPLVVLTGGEPLLQQRYEGWPLLLECLSGLEIGVETNGTLPPSEETLNGVSWITVSPKLAHAGDPAWARINGEVLVTWGRLAAEHDVDFSFVVRDTTDVATITTLVTIHGLPQERVWVTPEGTTPAAVLNRLNDVAGAALEAGFNVSPRMIAPAAPVAAGSPGDGIPLAALAVEPAPVERVGVGARLFGRSG